jgi:Tfp pilus assembly protein PilN
MRRLELDFQRRQIASPLGWGLLAAGLLVSALTLLGHLHLAELTALRAGELRHIEGLLQTGGAGLAPLSAGESRAQAASLAEMHRVSAQMNLPWAALLTTLESLQRKDIALLSLAPDARKGQLRISAEARALQAMLAFHRSLEQSVELRDVSLLNHEVVTQVAERPIRFNLLATWEVKDAHP